MYEPKYKKFIEDVRPYDNFNGPYLMNKLNPMIAAINILLSQQPKAAEEFEKWHERFKTIGD